MPRPTTNPIALVLPPEPDADLINVRYACRVQLAEIHNRYYGPISHRTFERWELEWRVVNGRAVTSVRDFLAAAQRRFDEAPVLRSGHRTTAEQQAA
jgi:hypothetical protein